MTTPAARFAEHYRARVQPRISRAIDVSAVLIALDQESFADQCDRITRRSWRLGGSHLAPELWAQLEEWISFQMAQRTMAADDLRVEQAAIAERVAQQVEAWERTLAA